MRIFSSTSLTPRGVNCIDRLAGAPVAMYAPRCRTVQELIPAVLTQILGQPGATKSGSCRALRSPQQLQSARADVLVVVKGVVGVVFGLDLGKSTVDAVAVSLANAAGIVVGVSGS